MTEMEIDVTHMVESADNMPMLSGSCAELGNDAGQITWNNSKAYGAEHPLLTTDAMRDAARDHFREYGAWTRKEIEAWSEERNCRRLCVKMLQPQFVRWKSRRIMPTISGFAKQALVLAASTKTATIAGTSISARDRSHGRSTRAAIAAIKPARGETR